MTSASTSRFTRRWPASSGMMSQLLRYGLALLGPVALAGTQFLLALQMLHVLTPEAFGIFSFLLIVSTLLTGVSNALLCAPLAVLAVEGDAEQATIVIRDQFAANIAFSAATGLLTIALGLGIGAAQSDAAIFGGFSVVAMLRWFGRAHAYAIGKPLRTTMSDLVTGFSLMAMIVAVALWGRTSAASAYAALLGSAAIGLFPFGKAYFRDQFRWPGRNELMRYAHVWRLHSRWSLIGVVTTEATGNAHAYIVTLLSGAAALASIAATALLTRPLTVVMNALTEFERPRMALLIRSGSAEELSRAVVLFRLVVLAAWVVSVAAAAGLLQFAPRLLFPEKYALSDLWQGAALWLGIVGLRAVRGPESVLLQAAGMFRWLAYCSVFSAVVSIAAVPVFLLIGGPIISLVGVLVGEIVFTGAIWRESRRWRAHHRGA